MLGVFSAVLILLCKDWIISLYNVSEETARLASQFLTVLGIASLGSCYEYPVEAGIIGGGGNTNMRPLWITALCGYSLFL